MTGEREGREGGGGFGCEAPGQFHPGNRDLEKEKKRGRDPQGRFG